MDFLYWVLIFIAVNIGFAILSMIFMLPTKAEKEWDFLRYHDIYWTKEQKNKYNKLFKDNTK